MSKQICKQRINGELAGRVSDLRQLWTLYRNDPEATTEDGANFNEYGLSFDYVAPGTFNGQRRGYFRYQISWGGPSDEFRFYAEGRGYRWTLDRVEYVFLDWFDGAKRTLSGDNLALLAEIFEDFADVGALESAYAKALEISPAL